MMIMRQLNDIGRVGIAYPANDKKDSIATESAAEKRLQSKANLLRIHEQNHRAVGGAYAGDIHYRYINGPDGKRYIIGGQVSIKVPRGGTPEEQIRVMEQIKRAALAPTAPSFRDLAVITKVELLETQARCAIKRKVEEYRKSSKSTKEVGYQLPDLTGLFNLVA